jgi:starvation-inducible DNA-binding protein
MDDLIKSMRECLANTFVMYFKAHTFHWNVEGINFPTYHEFFGNLYAELHGAVDPIAEEIRALDSYAPTGLNELYRSADIMDSNITGIAVPAMLEALIADNERLLSCLNNSFKLANDADLQGLADFIAGRIDVHKKHGWMLKASRKGA